MADDYIPTQICVVKVYLQCCQSCPKTVNKMLQKIKGVHGIYIDTEEGLVIVDGFLDPTLLIRTIEDVGIVAELLAYEKDPMEAEKKLDHYLKKMHKKKRNPHHQPASASLPENSDADGISHHHGYTDAGYMMPYDNVSQWSNSIPWHHQNYGMTRAFPAFTMQKCYPPTPRYIRRTRPPLPYPSSIYEQQDEPFHHLLSDDNVRACCLM